MPSAPGNFASGRLHTPPRVAVPGWPGRPPDAPADIPRTNLTDLGHSSTIPPSCHAAPRCIQARLDGFAPVCPYPHPPSRTKEGMKRALTALLIIVFSASIWASSAQAAPPADDGPAIPDEIVI